MIQQNAAAATEAASVAEGLAAQSEQVRAVLRFFTTDGVASSRPIRHEAVAAAPRHGTGSAKPRPANLQAPPEWTPGTSAKPKHGLNGSGKGASNGVALDLGLEDMTDADFMRS